MQNQKVVKMRELNLNVKAIKDQDIRETVQSIVEYIDGDLFGKFDGIHAEYTVTAAGTYVIQHNLDGIPKDVITTYCSSGTVTWNYTSFTKTQISFTTTGATTIRAFIGRFER